MAKERTFSDPAFRSQVILTGPALALYEGAQSQFERLKGLKNLGLLAHVHDVAVHSRHQHLVGLLRIFNKLCQQPKEKGLPKDFLWSFWARLCFAQTGHAAMSYDSEKAVLLAAHSDAGFKADLRVLIQPVIDAVEACPKCKKACPVRDAAVAEAGVWFEQMVERNRWHQLHRWIAALKLLDNAKLLDVLSGQVVNQNNRLGFSRPEALKMLIAPTCSWDTSFVNLSRMDFIVRDLAYAGTLGIQMDVDNLVACANLPHSDWKLLGNLSNYMYETLYESLSAQTVSVLFQRSLASLLISKKVGLDSLFGIGSATALDDEGVKSLVKSRVSGKEVFDADKRNSWQAWKINTYVDPKVVPCEIEKDLTGQKLGHLSRHSAMRTTCFKLRESNHLAIAISHQSKTERPEAKAFIKLCRSLLKRQYPKINAQQLIAALLEGLVGRTCDHGLLATAVKLGELPCSPVKLKRCADIVNKRSSLGVETHAQVAFKIGENEYPIRGEARALQINMMHAALVVDEPMRKSIGLSVEEASTTLWEELLTWQSIYFGLRAPQKILALVNEAQELFGGNALARVATSAADLELYTLLEALRHPSDGVSFRIALPNFKILNEDGTTENEYDVISIVLKEDKNVEVWVWGVTTDQNLTPKRVSDLTKIQKLKDLIGARWETDVRVVTCYVHLEGNEICREIDGRQDRRRVPVRS